MGVAWWHIPGGGGWGAVCLQNVRWGGGLGRNPKPSSCGSIWGAPCGKATEDGAWEWHSGMYQVVVVTGLWVCETRGEEGDWVKNLKPSHGGLVSSCNGVARGEKGCRGITVSPPVLIQRVGMGGE
jgi:hypothetical protein